MARRTPDRKFSKPSRSKRFKSDLPSVSVLDIFADADPDFLTAKPVGWKNTDTEYPIIIIESQRNDRVVPGPGDRILARLKTNDEGTWSAKPMKILPKPRRARIGIVKLDKEGARLLPVDRKQKEMRFEKHGLGEAKDGDLVEIEVRPTGRLMIDMARVTSVLGNPNSEGAVSLIALHNLEIPYRFPPDVLREAKAATETKMGTREDWRDMPFVTIDPANAKDHDDAVFAQSDPDPKNPGGYIVSIAIADVAAYVRPGTPLDEEAYLRGNSVYFPDRVVPMLPERISNELCSLRADEDRPALAARLIIDANGQQRKHTFHLVMIKVASSLNYAQAQKIFDGFCAPKTPASANSALSNLWDAYILMAKARDKRAPLDLDIPERRIQLDASGQVKDIVVAQRFEAHRLIEELMIAANVAAAEMLQKLKMPLIYRVHDQPGLEKLAALRDFLKSLDLSFTADRSVRTAHFNQVLKKARSAGQFQQVSEMVLRSQARAEYNPENIGHFGLNLANYAHFTSPIRRYADLLVHRALIAGLKLDEHGECETDIDNLAAIAADISGTERRAMAAERETQDRLIAHYLSAQVGARFSGVISGVTRAGLFVKLNETGADGFVPAATLGNDYFRFIQSQQAMIGDRTGERFRLGDVVMVRLLEAAPVAGALRFELLSDGERVQPVGKTGKKRFSKERARSKGKNASRRASKKTRKSP